MCGKVKLTHYFFCSSAIRQAIAKSLVAYYQKCEYNAYADALFGMGYRKLLLISPPVIGLFTSKQKYTSTDQLLSQCIEMNLIYYEILKLN